MTQTTPPPEQSQPAFDTFLRALARLLIVLLIGGCVIGLVAVSAIFYQQALRPARENAARLDQLETAQALSQEQRDEQLAQLEARLSALESQGTIDRQTLDELSGNVQALQATLDRQSQTLDELAQMKLQLAGLESIAIYNATESAGIVLTLRAGNPTVAQLQREVELLRAMQYLDQARIHMARANYGDAKTSVYNARQSLMVVLELAGEDGQPLVSTWLNRLDVISSELPNAPLLAAQDLELAWSSMAQGFSAQPVGVPVFLEDLTPTPTPYFTPTPVLDLSPTTTPYMLYPSMTPWVTPTPVATPTEVFD